MIIKCLLGRQVGEVLCFVHRFPLLDTLSLMLCFLCTLQMFLLKSLFFHDTNGTLRVQFISGDNLFLTFSTASIIAF